MVLTSSNPTYRSYFTPLKTDRGPKSLVFSLGDGVQRFFVRDMIQFDEDVFQGARLDLVHPLKQTWNPKIDGL